MSGVIAAVGDNNEGICGVSWHSKIMPLRVAYTSTNVAAAIEYANDNGALIINMSFGNYDKEKYGDGIVRDALDAAYENGLFLVATSGNDNGDFKRYPAALYNVIATSSTDSSDNKSSFSNYGLWIDIAAPGSSIITTNYPGGGYRSASGTSFAAPYVAGLAALLLSQNPTLTNIEVRAILENTPDLLETDYYIGTGRVNAANALSSPSPIYPLGEIVSPQDKHIIARDEEEIALSFLAYGDHYMLEYRSEGDDQWVIIDQGDPQQASQEEGLVYSSFANPGPGTYILRLTTAKGSYEHVDFKIFSVNRWYIKVMVGGSPSYNAFALDSKGNPHISYFDYYPSGLKYAYYNGSWYTEIVDGSYYTEVYNSLYLDNQDTPHISYTHITVPAFDSGLKYAYYDGSWHIEIVDSRSGDSSPIMFTSLALDSNGTTHISYYDGGNLKYAHYDGDWHVETVESEGDVGWNSSLAIDSNNNPHISYYKFSHPIPFELSNRDLKYAYYDGNWHIEIVDTDSDVVFDPSQLFLGEDISLVLNSNNNPHISYYDSISGSLQYAYYDESWYIETVDDDGDVGRNSSLALDSSNNPHISYYDATDGNLKYAYYDGSWHRETVDSDGDVGYSTSLALCKNDFPRISYYDQSQYVLKYASICHIDDPDCDDITSGEDNCPYTTNFYQEDGDADGIGDVCDNCSDDYNTDQGDSDGDGIGDICDICPNDSENDKDDDGICGDVDNCPYTPNLKQLNNDTDSHGDACDNCPYADNEDQVDTDGDEVGDVCDNCHDHPNSLLLGTCVKTDFGLIYSYRVGDPKDFITCTSDADCEATGGTCQMGQLDCNSNSCGDVCECYADYSDDLKLTGADLMVLKREYGRFDCDDPDPCYADGNEDGKVTGADLMLLKNEYGRFDCPSFSE